MPRLSLHWRSPRNSILVLAGVVFSLLSVPFAWGTDTSWTGATSTTWSVSGNWSAGAPGTSDNAVFNSTFSNQPTLTTNPSIGGLWMTGSVGQNVTISGSGQTLSLGGNTINGTAGLGILVDNANAYTLTISCGIKLLNAQTWTNNSGNVLTISGAVDTNKKDLTVNGSGNTTISGVISNHAALTFTGTGTLTLSGVNTFDGLLTIQSGSLSIGTINNDSTDGVLGNNSLAVILGGSGTTGTLRYTGSTASSTKKFTMATGGTGTFQITTAGTNLTLSGVIDGSGALTKTGTGTLTLTGTNTYTGGSTINAGTVVVNSAASLGATSGGVTLNAGTVEVSTGFSTSRVYTLGDAASTFQVDSGQTFTLSSIIGGTGALNKTGTGTMVLSGINTYSGGTVLGAGTLQLSGSGTLGSTGGTLTVNGGTVDLNGTNQTVGNLTGSGGTILNNSTGTNRTLTIGYSNGTGGNYAGVIADHTSGTGTVALTKTGTGTITLSGTNTFTGATTVSGGTLTVAGASTGALGSTASITVNSGGTLLLGANNQINNSATMTLNGGTFAKGGYYEGTSSSVGLGALTLTATGSHVDFGTGTVGVLTFASFSPGLFTLTIDNWTGTPNTVGTASTDRLIFNSDQVTNLSSFAFTGYLGATEFSLGGGYYEVVPFAPVPEPATYAAGILSLTVVVWQQRRRIFRRSRSR